MKRANLAARSRMIVLSMGLVFLGTGCHSIGNPSRTMVPFYYRGNPWGLDANLKRASGEFPAVKATPKMAEWEAWGRAHLQNGDVLFRMGDARVLLGLFPFSVITAEIGESLFSHTAIVAKEGEELVVYDISKDGPSRQPYGVWMLDFAGAYGVKRPRPEYQDRVAAAVAFCRNTYRNQTPYDFGMKLGHDELYCIEMTELAYRSAGLPLSAPVPITKLPGYPRHKRLAPLVELVSKIERNHPVFMPGNDTFGLWSSPALETVYFAPDAEKPLPDGIVTRPYGPGYR